MNIKNKWFFGIVSTLVIILSMVFGGVIANKIFKRAFIVWKDAGNNICTVTLVRGQIEGFTGGGSFDVDEIPVFTTRGEFEKIIKGIHNNNIAIEAMDKYINETGGHMISSSS